MKAKRTIKRKCDEGLTARQDTTGRIEKPKLPFEPIKYKYSEREQPTLLPDNRSILQKQQSDKLREQANNYDKLYSSQHLWGGIGGPVSRSEVPLRYEKEKGNAIATGDALAGEAIFGLANRVLRHVGEVRKIRKEALDPINASEARKWTDTWNQSRVNKFSDLYVDKFNGNISLQNADRLGRDAISSASTSAKSSPVYNVKDPKSKAELFELFKNSIDSKAYRGKNVEKRFEDFIKQADKSGILGTYVPDIHASIIFNKGGQSSAIHEVAHSQKLSAIERFIDKLSDNEIYNPHGYWDSGREIYARLMETRWDLSNKGLLSPFKDVTKNDLSIFREALKDLPSRKLIGRYKDDTLLKLFNNVPAVAGAVSVGTTALNSEEYKEGKTSENMKKKTIKKNLPKYQAGLTNPYTAAYNMPNKLTAPQGATDAWNSSVSRAGDRVVGGGNTGSNLGNMGNIAGSAVNAISAQMDVWGSPDIQQPLSTSIAKGPIQYQKTEYINKANEMRNLSSSNAKSTLGSVGTGAAVGAAAGSVAGPIGGVIGGAVGALGGLVSGIFGGAAKRRKLRRKIARENQRITSLNQFNLAEAQTGTLQQEYLNENEDTQDDVLYNKGKSKYDAGRNANSWVGNGETIVDGNTGELEEVTDGQGVGIDDVPANIQPEDAIAGNLRNPFTGNTFAEDMKPLTRMEKRLNRNMKRNTQSIANNTAKLTKAYTQPLAQQILADQAMVHYNMGKLQEEVYDDGKSGIHIKPSKRGTFTAAAKRHGAGVQEFASRVLANKENYSPAMVKKANFARNASKWSHNDGKSGIHIKPENRGKFTASANRAGMGVQEFAGKVLANKENYSSTLVKRANFARNAAKWNKHADGKVADIFGQFGESVATLGPSLYNLYQGQQPAQTVSPSQLYSPNTRANQALNLMASRRYNVQPELRQLRDFERRSRYNTRQIGSESGINRAMDVAGGLNMQRAISDVYGRQQNANNQYLGEQAQLGATLGAQEAAGRGQAMQSAYDINARNRAARSAYTGAALTGISEYTQNQRKLRNQKAMDDMRMRALRSYLEMNTTGGNIDYLLKG